MKRAWHLAALLAMAPLLVGWGFFGHRLINRNAVFTLPTELMVFYKKHINYLSEHSVDADKRRYAIEAEAPRHYIDLDLYDHVPLNSLQVSWSEAVERFSEDSLMAKGVVPWHIGMVYRQLVKAFEAGDTPRILKLSADLGHYVGDAHVPLHTTSNYNGQKTNQHGIHGFWESRLPELFSADYDLLTGQATYISDVDDAAWRAVIASHQAVDSVLNLEASIKASLADHEKFSFEERGASTVKVYSSGFSNQYHRALDGMVERRLKAAIALTGNLWFSAWIDGGQPSLNSELSSEAIETMEAENKALEAEYMSRSIKGRQHDD